MILTVTQTSKNGPLVSTYNIPDDAQIVADNGSYEDGCRNYTLRVRTRPGKLSDDPQRDVALFTSVIGYTRDDFVQAVPADISEA